MSHRPVLKKRVNKLRKAMRSTPVGYIDPVDYLVTRRLAPSKRAARLLIFEGRLRSESHKVGFAEVPTRNEDGVVSKQKMITAVPASMRSTLAVV